MDFVMTQYSKTGAEGERFKLTDVNYSKKFNPIASCALLAPTLLVRWLVTPRLWMSAPHLLPLAASATILGSVFVLTPLAVAAVPAHVPIAIEDLEDEIRLELQRRAAGDQRGRAGRVFSGRVLY